MKKTNESHAIVTKCNENVYMTTFYDKEKMKKKKTNFTIPT